MRLRLFFIGALALGLACTGGGKDDDSGGVDVETDADVDADTDSDTDGDPDQDPVIIEFSVNPTSISDRESADFYALVTDPQGIDDLIGGSLKANGATLAAFSGAADEGSYSTTVDFDTLADAYGQDSNGPSGTLTLTASFSDQVGNTSTADLDLDLTCDNGEHLCMDGCTDVQEDADNCGGCGIDCATEIANSDLDPLPIGAVCDDMGCVGTSECFTRAAAGNRSCNDVCDDLGADCHGTVIFTGDCSSAFDYYGYEDYCSYPMKEFMGDEYAVGCGCIL